MATVARQCLDKRHATDASRYRPFPTTVGHGNLTTHLQSGAVWQLRQEIVARHLSSLLRLVICLLISPAPPATALALATASLLTKHCWSSDSTEQPLGRRTLSLPPLQPRTRCGAVQSCPRGTAAQRWQPGAGRGQTPPAAAPEPLCPALPHAPAHHPVTDPVPLASPAAAGPACTPGNRSIDFMISTPKNQEGEQE